MRSQFLQVGDHISLSGGYEPDSEWLGGRQEVSGVLTAFIQGQNASPAAVVKLDAPMTAGGQTGDIVVLALRYTGATWVATGTVHLELCDFPPEPKRWQDRRQGQWIESDATYRLVDRQAVKA